VRLCHQSRVQSEYLRSLELSQSPLSRTRGKQIDDPAVICCPTDTPSADWQPTSQVTWRLPSGWRSACSSSSAEPRPGFFSSGLYYVGADLNAAGTMLCRSDWLNRWLRNGARSPTHSSSSQVGSGSDEHCLSGSFSTAAATASAETAVKSGNVQSVSMKTGSAAQDVVAWMSATFLSKNSESWWR